MYRIYSTSKVFMLENTVVWCPWITMDLQYKQGVYVRKHWSDVRGSQWIYSTNKVFMLENTVVWCPWITMDLQYKQDVYDRKHCGLMSVDHNGSTVQARCLCLENTVVWCKRITVDDCDCWCFSDMTPTYIYDPTSVFLYNIQHLTCWCFTHIRSVTRPRWF